MTAPPHSETPYDLPDEDEPYDLPEEVEPFELPEDTAEYDLLVVNDDTHTAEYVAGLLEKLFGFTWAEGYALAWEIHNRGRAVVFTGSREQVERKRARVVAYGPDPWWPWSTGPLAVEIRESA